MNYFVAVVICHIVTEHRHTTTWTLLTCGKELLKGQNKLDTLTVPKQLHTSKYRPLIHYWEVGLFAQVGCFVRSCLVITDHRLTKHCTFWQEAHDVMTQISRRKETSYEGKKWVSVIYKWLCIGLLLWSQCWVCCLLQAFTSQVE